MPDYSWASCFAVQHQLHVVVHVNWSAIVTTAGSEMLKVRHCLSKHIYFSRTFPHVVYLMVTSVNSFGVTVMHFAAISSLTHFLNQDVFLTITIYLKISKGSGRQSFSMTCISSFVLFLHLQFPPVQGRKRMLISACFGRPNWSSSCVITLTAFPFIYQSFAWQRFRPMNCQSHTLRVVKQHLWGGHYF